MWLETTLGAEAQVTVGFVGPMASEYRESGIPFLRSLNVRPHRVDWAEMKFIDDEFHQRLKKSALSPGDVVTVRTGKPGQTAVIPEGLPEANCSDLVVTRPGPNLDPRWLSYQLNWMTDSHIAGHLVGAVQQHFNVKSAQSLRLLLPPLAEQRAIAEVLGALDDKIAANTHLVSLAVELADTEYRRARAGVDLVERTYGEVASISGGGTPKTAVDGYWGGNVRWATPTDVTRLGAPYLEDTSRMITEDGLVSCASKLYPRASILMTSRATIGAFALAQQPTAVNQGFIVVNAHDPDNQMWLFHDMRARVDEFVAHANGATFLELPRGRFKALPVKVPLVGAAQFDRLVGPLHELGAQMQREARVLADTRDTLLPLLMSGKLRVKDAERKISEVL